MNVIIISLGVIASVIGLAYLAFNLPKIFRDDDNPP